MAHNGAAATDVIVVGAGPTGLMLAGDLARAGVGVTLIERRETDSNLTRAFAVHARTLEELDARGLADELLATGTRLSALRLFGGVRVDLSRLDSRFPYLQVTPQYEVERVLEKYALANGAVIEKGARLIGLRQDADGVDLEVVTGDRVTRRRASYVVGTDGVRSSVRQALGLDFPGGSAISSVMLADVRFTENPGEALFARANDQGLVFMAPFGDGYWRVIAWDRATQLPDSAPVDVAELKDLMTRVMGTDLGLHDPRWTSRFHSDERQVTDYRVGRVFLAGDAAHVHSPAGGQGMNTGIQDAANLGWKLAAAVHGHAPEGLLDTYHAERHPVGKAVLRTSGALLRMATLKTRGARTLRDTVGSLATGIRPVAARATGRVSGLAIAYGAPAGSHKLTGTRAPDLTLTEGRLYEALREGRHVLVLGPDAPAPADAGRALVVRATEDTPALLVRPDAYIAWAGEAPGARAGLAASGLL
ncbi:FAD-dependent oxidoreductase [Actinorhabdospora filicis]|uniref:FAD-dependent oxidoreductase n=1 Tax=Actinorhabdospora filicis TaxID=1785913 RepID=A0A9W6SQX1_9ACTN|nr:FAD-dependent monooxygenase [Actinorhabdospora filicis]GLZ80641.1 FAD-dependent oxidoreductase [Actinorhabdospora filicis]